MTLRKLQAACIGALVSVASWPVTADQALDTTNRRAVARIKSVETGTGFVIFAAERKLYVLTAAHVVGADQPQEPPCKLDFGTPNVSMPCRVRYVWAKGGTIDLAVVEADASKVPGSFAATRLGDSGMLPNNGVKVYTLGYTGGGTLTRKDGVTSGMDAPQILLDGIKPQQGDSGSPVFSSDDGTVIGIITDKYRDQTQQRASEIDQIKLYLRREIFFRTLVQLNRPPAGATGPLVASDLGPSLTSIFANAASPQRWYDRAKRYTRADLEVPQLFGGNSWLGLRRVYVSSFSDHVGDFGHGWATAFDYKVDVDHSTLCKIYFWNPRGVRVPLDSVLGCGDVKSSLASQVSDPKILDRPLRELLNSADLSQRLLPDNGPSYVGADYEVGRLRYVANGLELTIGRLQYGFNADGKLRYLRSFGRTIDLDYDIKDRLAVVREGTKSQEFIYSETGRVSVVRFSDGTQFEYSYDKSDNLVKVSSAGTDTYVYQYDANHRLTHVEYCDDSRVINISYNSEGVRTSVVLNGEKEFRWSFHDSVNDMPMVEQTLLTKGQPTDERKYEFDYQERRLSLTIEGKLTNYVLTQCLCLPLVADTPDGGGRIDYRYDVFGRLIGEKTSEREIQLHYDDRVNKVDKIELKEGEQWITQAEAKFDLYGNMISVKSENSSVELTYDRGGNIASIFDRPHNSLVKIKYNQIGKPKEVSIPSVGTIFVTYKPDGKIKEVNAPEGPSVAVKVAGLFNNLLDAVAPFTERTKVDTRFSLITSEPGGCDECTNLIDF